MTMTGRNRILCEWRRNDEKCETLVVVGACNPAPSPASIQPRIFRQAASRANQRFLRPRLDQSRQGLTILQNAARRLFLVVAASIVWHTRCHHQSHLLQSEHSLHHPCCSPPSPSAA